MKMINLCTIPMLMLMMTFGFYSDSMAQRGGTIAIMPFDFVTNDGGFDPDQYSKQVQTYCAESFRKNTSGLDVQDPMRTNALLIRNNITKETMAGYLPDEIAKILEVDYLAYGHFNLTYKGDRTSNSEYSSYKDKEKVESKSGSSGSRHSSNSGRDYEREKENKGSQSSTSSSTTTANYDALMEVTIYDADGTNVWNRSKEPFSADAEAFHSSLDYILKRSPWGSKYKPKRR